MGGWGMVGEACRVSGSTSGEPWPRLASHGEPLPNRLPTVLGDSGQEPLEMPWKGMGQSGDLGQTKVGLPVRVCSWSDKPGSVPSPSWEQPRGLRPRSRHHDECKGTPAAPGSP